MTLNVVALDNQLFKSKYLSLPDESKLLPFKQQIQAANKVFEACVEECHITKFDGEVNLPERPVFDGWAGALPDMEKLVACFEFLKQLIAPEKPNASGPWWVNNASHQAILVQSEELKSFSEDIHACKFFEVFLANAITGKSAQAYIELGEFLELSALNDCAILSWR